MFRDKSVVVTGAASGIGWALSQQLARAGARVVLADIDAALVNERVEALRLAGLSAAGRHVDVTVEDQVEDLLTSTSTKNGRLDAVFNNAGIGGTLPIAEADIEHWRRLISVNLWSVIYGTTVAYRIMAAQGAGHIVNTASISGLIPVPMQTLYNTTKYAVVGLSTSLRPEAAVWGVTVSVVCPGRVDTAIWGVPIIGPKVAASAPPGSLPADRAAKTILHGVARKKAIIVLPARDRVWARAYGMAPGLVAKALAAGYRRRHS
jgi:NAD(P)-dependent dehydrogenase (short-subunit alcohol dehydrogenase family)